MYCLFWSCVSRTCFHGGTLIWARVVCSGVSASQRLGCVVFLWDKGCIAWIRYIQQRIQAMQPLSHRKTTHPKRWEALTPEQTTRAHIKVPPWKQVLLTQLQKRQYMKHHTNYHQSTVINMYANVYIGVTIQKLHQLSDDRITRETLSNNNPCPSSPSSTILRSAYMALNTLQQDWLL